MRQQQGFTLIELVAVIVILGILAAVAAPKFIDLSSDAYEAKLDGLEGALKSANTMVFAKAVIAGETQKENGSVSVNGSTIATRYGYIAPTLSAVKSSLDVSFSDISGPSDSFTEDYGIFVTSNVVMTANPSGPGFECLLQYSFDTNNQPVYTRSACN